MMSRFCVAAAIMLALLTVNAKASNAGVETALEVQSWCKGITSAKVLADNKFFYNPTPDTRFCWGAFGAIQELSTVLWDDDTPMLRVCVPAESTRLQLVKIFSKYVDDHPEISHQPFAIIARQSLAEAFPCH
jgi:hypothetical protein